MYIIVVLLFLLMASDMCTDSTGMPSHASTFAVASSALPVLPARCGKSRTPLCKWIVHVRVGAPCTPKIELHVVLVLPSTAQQPVRIVN